MFIIFGSTELEELSRKQLRELRRIRRTEKKILGLLQAQFNQVVSFRVTQENSMAIVGIVSGATGTFTATPLNAAGNPVGLPLPVVPFWNSSDQGNDPVTAGTDGLTASVVDNGAHPNGTTIILTVQMPDGTAATAVSVPILPAVTPPDNVVASFAIDQTS